MATAPDPPEGFEIPEGYLAMRCQFCQSWSTEKCPYTPRPLSACRWWPLLPWYRGTRESPSGQICLLCANVHQAGGWDIRIGNLRKCAQNFKTNPTQLHLWQKQRDSLVEKKQANPLIRIRNAEQLGVAQSLMTNEESSEVLTAPLQFFVSATTYTTMMRQPPPDGKIECKTFQGQPVLGVTVVGRMWNMAWEDGQSGIYKLEGKSSTGVVRTNILIDPEDAVLGDSVVDEAEKKTTALLFGNSNRVTNEPNVDKACAMLGIGGISAELDDILGDGFGQDDPCASSGVAKAPKVLALTAPGALPSPAQEVGANCDDAPPPLTGFDKLRLRSSGAAASSAEKAKPKPKAKGKATAKPKAAKEEELEEPPTKRRKGRGGGNVENVDPANNSRTQGQSTEAMEANDAAWHSSTKEALVDLMHLDPPEAEGEFKTAVSDRARDIAEMRKQITSRKRTLRRRSQENQEKAMAQAKEIEESANEFHSILNVLCQRATIPADECVVKMESLIAQGATFGREVTKRMVSLLWQEDMKFQRWTDMMGKSLKLLQAHVPESDTFSHAAFILQQMTVILQKLLKTIPSDKVSLTSPLPDEMSPLLKFISVMSIEFVTEEEKTRFAWLKLLLLTSGHTPGEVDDALQKVKTDTSAVVCSFRAIPQGKKIISLSDQHNQSKSHLLKISQEIVSVSQACDVQQAALSAATKPDDAFRQFSSLVTSVKNLGPKVPADDKASQKLLGSTKESLREFGKKLITHHFSVEGWPWIESQCKTLAASKIISRPPAFHILGLNAAAEKVVGPFQEVIDLQEFYSEMAGIAESTEELLRSDRDDSGKLREVALRFCQRFQSWNSSLLKYRCACPESFEPTEKMRGVLTSLVTDMCTHVWRDTISHPLQIATRVIQKNPFDAEFLKGARDKIADSRLLLTGLSDADTSMKETMTMIATFMEDMIAFAESDLEDPEQPKAISLSLKMFKNMGLVPAEQGLTGEISFDEDASKLVCNTLWEALCASPDSDQPKITVADLETGFGRLRKNMVVAFQSCQKHIVEKISAAVDKARSLQPFPEYDEKQDGCDKSFLDAIASGKRHVILSQAIDAMESGLQRAQENASIFGIPSTSMVPNFDEVQKELVGFTQVSALATCLRILSSRAAQSFSHALLASTEKMIDFVKDKNVKLPESVTKRMSTLLAKIKESSSTADRSRSRKASQA